jgi:hypothetical protein
MRKAVGIVITIVILLGLKFHNRSSDQNVILDDMKSLIAKLQISAKDTAYLNGILDREHSKAFDAAYTMGGRRRGATLDDDKYIEAIFKAMISQCAKDKKKELVAKLTSAREAIRSAGKESAS